MPTRSLGDILAGNADMQPKPGSLVRSARSRNRAAAWSYDLEQWRAYRLAMATADAQRSAIEREYEELAAAGPDFTSYHVGSDFSEPHAHDLDKGGKQAVLTAFDQVRGWLYRNTRKPHGQAVSRVYREVLSVLLSFAIKYGKVFPSQATIAKLACCSERTVANALAWLKLWGFLTWRRRLKRVASGLGIRTRQASNAYKLVLSGLAAIGSAVFSNAPNRNNYSPFSIRMVGKASPTHRQPLFARK
jgi:helix-turn-helix protein